MFYRLTKMNVLVQLLGGLCLLLPTNAFGESPRHFKQKSENALQDEAVKSAGPWELGGETVFDPHVSTQPGSGSLRFRTPWIKDYLYFKERYGSPASYDFAKTALIEVKAGQLVTFSAKIRTEAWPPPFLLIEVTGYKGDRSSKRHLAASRQAPSAPNEWQEIAVLARVPDDVKFAQVKVVKCLGPYEGQPVKGTYVGRMANDGADYHGEMWLDEVRFAEGVGFKEPPTPKRPFEGERIRIDVLGNFELKREDTWQPFFPFCIYGDDARPLEFYARQGFNCEIRAKNINRMIEAKKAGMMFGFDITGYFRPDNKKLYNNTEHLLEMLEAMELAGVRDHQLLYHWDNENTHDEWAVLEHVSKTLKQWDQRKGHRQIPIYALNGMEGIARAFRDMIDVTGDYTTHGGGGAEGGGDTAGLIVLNNIQNQSIPVSFAQLNLAGHNMRPVLYDSLMAGGKAMGFWRDHFSNKGLEKFGQKPIDQLPWWPEFPAITQDIQRMLPLIREPNYTDWRLTADSKVVRYGTRNYQGEGYVIVSNSTDKPVKVEFTVHELPYQAQSAVDFLTGNVLSSVSDNSFCFSIPAYGGTVCRLIK